MVLLWPGKVNIYLWGGYKEKLHPEKYQIKNGTGVDIPPPPLLSQVPLEASNSIAARKKSILITYREALLYLQQFLTPCVDMSNEEERNNFQQLPAKVNLQTDKVSYRVTWITSKEQDTPLGVSLNQILIQKCMITRPNRQPTL